MSAREARAMGLQIGDTIEGTQGGHTARLTLLWLGEDVTVWRYWSRLDGDSFVYQGESADWELTCRAWTKLEQAK